MISFFTFSALVNAITSLFLGVIIFLKDHRSRSNLNFGLFCLSVGLWSIGYFFWQSANNGEEALFWVRFLMGATIFIPVFYLHFVFSFLGIVVKKYVVILEYLFVGLFLLADGTKYFVESVTPKLYFDFWPNPGVVFHLFLIAWLALIFYATSLLFSYFKKSSGVFREQLKFILIGMLVGYLGGISNYFLWYNINIPPFLNIFVSIYVILVAYSILKHHLFNIRIIFVEISLVLFNFLFFANTVFSKSFFETIFHIIVFCVIFIFSIVLLRGIYKDIRNRDLAEKLAQEMIEANKRLEQMEEQKVEFVAIASHQLRTPLTVIKGYTSMILEGTFGFVEQGARDAIKKIYDASEKVIALVEDLLTVSRLEHGRSALQFAVVDFSEIVKEMVELVGPEIKKVGLGLHFFVEEKKFLVLLDEKKIRQILRHILENTFKYTLAPGSVRVVLVRDNVTGNARLLISDTGNGMSKEQIRTLFAQYEFNAQDDMTTQFEMAPTSVLPDVQTQEEVFLDVGDKVNHTSGIGLYLAKEIIGAHQGTLLVESAGIKKGTTIIIELPCQNDEEQE